MNCLNSDAVNYLKIMLSPVVESETILLRSLNSKSSVEVHLQIRNEDYQASKRVWTDFSENMRNLLYSFSRHRHCLICFRHCACPWYRDSDPASPAAALPGQARGTEARGLDFKWVQLRNSASPDFHESLAGHGSLSAGQN
jgi:hypothetical protein